MAHEEHFTLLKQGVDAWNSWRLDHPEVRPNFSTAHLTDAVLRKADLRGADLSGADLMGADLMGAILTDADLSGAILSGAVLSDAVLNGTDLMGAILSGAVLNGAIMMEANLSGAILTNAVLSDAVLRRADLIGADLAGANLSGANLIGAKLNGADLMGADFSRAYLMTVSFADAVLSEADFSSAHLSSADLVRANLSNAILNEADLSGANLSEANLKGADLTNADLKGANLNDADLKGTNLKGANLCVTQALNANFHRAVFTGACIEDWQINSDTNLDSAICDYVYLQSGQEERSPSNGNFAPGDFTKRFQKALDKVDLFFHNGINWIAFACALKVEAEAEGVPLRVNTIEEMDDGAILVRLKIPLEANKDEIQTALQQKYDFFYRSIEERDRTRTTDTKEQINQLLNMAGQQSSVQMATGSSNSTVLDSDAASFQSHEFLDVETVHTPLTDSSQVRPDNQNLTEAAAEIRQLLKQLEQTYPFSTPLEKQILVTVAIKRIESNPLLRLRVSEALTAAGTVAFKELVNNPLANILVAALEGWKID